MGLTCEYCRGACVEGTVKCDNCGAPLGETPEIDFRFCPFCTRKLLALGSPACNYCGRRLPDSFLKAHQSAIQRIGAVIGEPAIKEADQNIGQVIGEIASRGDSISATKSMGDLIGSLIDLID